MTHQQITEAVAAIIAIILKCDLNVTGDIQRKNTDAWDSLKHIEVMFAIEDEFNIEFSEEELVQLDGLNKIVESIEAKNAA